MQNLKIKNCSAFFIYLILFVFYLLLTGCGGGNKEPISQPTTITIQGRIINATDTNKSINGAIIQIIPKQKNFVKYREISSTADNSGYYVLKDVPIGKMNINILLNGYKNLSFDVDTTNLTSTIFNITLIPNSFISEPANLFLTPESITIPAGNTQKFTTEIKDSAGNILNLTPIYFIEGNCGVIYPNGEFTGIKEGTCKINSIIGTSNGYIKDYSDIKVEGKVIYENKIDEYPLGVGYWWHYKQDYNIEYYDSPGQKVSTEGIQYFITKVDGTKDIDGKNCYVVKEGGGTQQDLSEYNYYMPSYFLWKTQDGAFKIGYESNGQIEKYAEPQKYIQLPLSVGISWNRTEPWNMIYSVIKKESITTPLGSFEAFRIDVGHDGLGPNDYYRFWVANGIGFIQEEARIEFDCYDPYTVYLGKGVWHEISKLINYHFPKAKDISSLPFAYPVDERIKEIIKIKKYGLKYLESKYKLN